MLEGKISSFESQNEEYSLKILEKNSIANKKELEIENLNKNIFDLESFIEEFKFQLKHQMTSTEVLENQLKETESSKLKLHEDLMKIKVELDFLKNKEDTIVDKNENEKYLNEESNIDSSFLSDNQNENQFLSIDNLELLIENYFNMISNYKKLVIKSNLMKTQLKNITSSYQNLYQIYSKHIGQEKSSVEITNGSLPMKIINSIDSYKNFENLKSAYDEITKIRCLANNNLIFKYNLLHQEYLNLKNVCLKDQEAVKYVSSIEKKVFFFILISSYIDI